MLFKKGKGQYFPAIPAPRSTKVKMTFKAWIKQPFVDKNPWQIAWMIFKWIFAPRNWKLIIIFFPLLLTTTRLLREDHIKMTQLRDDVIAADRTENDVLINETLEKLKDFVFNNIVVNVVDNNGERIISYGTGPFYLEHLYMRAASDALYKASQGFTSDDNPNGNIYKEASLVCKERAIKNNWTWDNPNFINCMVTEIEKIPSSEEIQDQIIAAIPPTDLYRRNYASPAWAPTASGWCMLALAAVVVVIFIRTIFWIIYGIALLFV